MEIEAVKLYPTTIHKVRIPEMLPYHDQIYKIVMDLVLPGDIDKGGARRHVGYQLKPVLFERTEECFLKLKQYHELALRIYLRTDSYYRNTFRNQEVPEHLSVCWPYVQNEQQLSSYVHHHGASGVNAIYYVKCPSNLEGHQGNISFVDPRGPGITSLLGCPIPSEGSFHRPEEGLMILFPSWLQHRPMPMISSPGWRVSLGIDTNFFYRLGAEFRIRHD